MKHIRIGEQDIPVKDYHCSYLDDEEYIEKSDGKLWLYINVTDICNANCPFCVNPSGDSASKILSLEKLKLTLEKIKDYVYGVSITGGEPMLYPKAVDAVVELINDVLENVSITLVSNGTNIHMIPELRSLEYFESIHISRHSHSDDINRKLMSFEAPSISDIRAVIEKISDPAKIVLNCVMQKCGVNDIQTMKQYLDAAIDAGVRNASFVGFFIANEYCKDNYISPASIELNMEPEFRVWNRFKDHEFCSCSSGDYINEKGTVRYYYRCPGQEKADYARQLVYTADNKLLLGFGGPAIVL